MTNYSAEVTIVVEAKGEEEAFEIIKNLKNSVGITDVDIQDGPNEIDEETNDDDDDE